MTSGCAFPNNVPEIKYTTLSQDIVTNNKYTYVSYAVSVPFTAISNVDYTGYVTLNPNYNDANMYFIYGSFELSSSTYQNHIPRNVVVTSIVKNTSNQWQFEWWFRMANSITLGIAGKLNFAIFFYAPLLSLTYVPTNNAPALSPTTLNGIPSDSNFLSNSFPVLTPPYNDLVNYFPIISYHVQYVNVGTTPNYYFGTVTIPDYNSSYIVLTSYELAVSITAPTFNTSILSAITIYDKNYNSFKFAYHVNNSANFYIIFIIFYTDI